MAPRIEVDFNKWGVSAGRGRVHLPDPELQRLAAEGIEVRAGSVVRAVDQDVDDEDRPCWLEVDATVGWDDERGWYATYEQRAMSWVPKCPS